MIRIHKSANIKKFINGDWELDEEDKFHLVPRIESHIPATKETMVTGYYKFRCGMTQLEEYVFCREFERSEDTFDADCILLQDIKNLVLFLSPPDMLTKKFLEFIHTRTIHNLMHALIIYFEYYLRMIEFVLIRRDEVSGDTGLIQSKESVAIKRVFSDRLSEYRLLVAREYRTMILGEDDMAPFYHIMPLVNISQTETDRYLHEKFIAFATQVVWIAMHRRAYDDINQEMGRLFRSEHFNIVKREKTYSQSERDLLYGRKYKYLNYRYQTSPLTQEILRVPPHNSPILDFGKLKYRGEDLRLRQLEMEYLVPESQLLFIDTVHGILGHPKKIYNTLLTMNNDAVRYEHYTESYDPYGIKRQPIMDIPQLDEEAVRERCEHAEHFFSVSQDLEAVPVKDLKKWKNRDGIIDRYIKEGIVVDIAEKVAIEAAATGYGPPTKVIRARYLKRRAKLMKRPD